MKKEPFEQKALYFRAENRKLRAVIRELRDMVSELSKEKHTFRDRLVRTEKFLVTEGYRRLDSDGHWTKEPLSDE